MVENTRYARVQPSVAPLRTIDGTRVSSLRRAVPSASIEQLFRERHRVMASAVSEESRPGLFVFAAHHQYGLVGRLWLEATSAPRAGLIGRHDGSDLALPLDEALSLRHLMFVVRRQGSTVRFVALDLESNNGLRLEKGREVKLVEATGPLIVSASQFIFFCFPTGSALPWDPTSRDPWSTLAPRSASREELPANVEAGAPAGRLEVTDAFGIRSARVGSAALRRGVLVGRDGRCDLRAPDETVSRVHVVQLTLDEQLFVIDAGSTNGTWRRDEEIHIERLGDRDVLELGNFVSLSWHDAQ